MKVVCFDLDDTILDTKKCNEEIFYNIKKDLNISMNDERFTKKFRSILRINMLKLDPYIYNEEIGIDPIDYFWMEEDVKYGDISRFKKDVFNEMKHIFNLDTTYEKFEKIIKNTSSYYRYTVSGMLEVITFIKEFSQIALITNGIKDVQRMKIKNANLEKYFDYIFVSGEVGSGKPNHVFYNHVIKTVNSEPENMIMIGDNLQNDYFGAIASGINAIYFSKKEVNYEVLQKKNPEELFESLRAFVIGG